MCTHLRVWEKLVRLMTEVATNLDDACIRSGTTYGNEFKLSTACLLSISMEGYVLERNIERNLVRIVRTMGGIAPKLVSPGYDGMPDRIVLLPGGKHAFVEVKAPGEAPRPLQRRRHALLRRLGFRVYVLDHPERIRQILTEIGGDAQ